VRALELGLFLFVVLVSLIHLEYVEWAFLVKQEQQLFFHLFSVLTHGTVGLRFLIFKEGFDSCFMEELGGKLDGVDSARC